MTILYMLYTVACVQIHAVTVPFFNRNFIEEGLTSCILRISLVGIALGKKFYIVLLCCSCFPVLIVNLSILNHFNNNDFS